MSALSLNKIWGVKVSGNLPVSIDWPSRYLWHAWVQPRAGSMVGETQEEVLDLQPEPMGTSGPTRHFPVSATLKVFPACQTLLGL